MCKNQMHNNNDGYVIVNNNVMIINYCITIMQNVLVSHMTKACNTESVMIAKTKEIFYY